MSARRRIATLGLALPLLAVAAPAPAMATGIVVTTLGDVDDGSDAACSLREAIDSARTNGASGGVAGECPAGGASDTITFGVSGLIELASGLPDVGHGTTIDGADEIIIDGNGHGIFQAQDDATVTIRRLVLLDAGGAYGPALYLDGSSVVDRVIVIDSVATEWGGGILVATDANVTITDSTFEGNRAKFGGGIYVANGAKATIVRTTVSRNVTQFGGAGVYGLGADQVTIANSTIYGNGGGDGAGIYMSNTDLTIYNSTITRNESAGGGGGMSIDPTPVNVMVNTIVTGNTDSNASAPDDVWGTLDTSTANLIGAAYAGVLDAAGLADNGGRTATVRLVAGATDAIGKGDTAGCQHALVNSVDQRGLARPAGSCDIGAVERDLVAPVMGGKPAGSLVAATTLDGKKPRVKLTWDASDAGIGVGSYLVQRSVAGGSWTTVRTVKSPELVVTLPAKAAQYRVTPIDYDGNAGAPTASRTLQATLTQQTYAGITYGKTWKTAKSASYSGKAVKHAKAKGASARFLFTGRGIGFVTTVAPNRGKAKIYINGSLVDTVDLGGAAKYRVVAWQKTWSSSATRTIKVVVAGTSGRPRVDVDAFVVLK